MTHQYDRTDKEETSIQSYSITIMWSPETEERLTPDDLQALVKQAVLEMDNEANVEVTEINHPTY